MAKISVELRTLRLAKGVCDTAIHGLNDEAKSIKAAYAEAGTGWNDASYRKVGTIIQEAVDALKKPVSSLEESKGRIEKAEIILQKGQDIFN